MHIKSHATIPCGVAISVRSHPLLDEVLSPKTCKTKWKNRTSSGKQQDKNNSLTAFGLPARFAPPTFTFLRFSSTVKVPRTSKTKPSNAAPRLTMRQKRRNLEWCVKSAWQIFYLTYPPPSSIPINLLFFYLPIYKDQQIVTRHRGRHRCTLAARSASPLQSVPGPKSCEWNGIPIKLMGGQMDFLFGARPMFKGFVSYREGPTHVVFNICVLQI